MGIIPLWCSLIFLLAFLAEVRLSCDALMCPFWPLVVKANGYLTTKSSRAFAALHKKVLAEQKSILD